MKRVNPKVPPPPPPRSLMVDPLGTEQVNWDVDEVGKLLNEVMCEKSKKSLGLNTKGKAKNSGCYDI